MSRFDLLALLLTNPAAAGFINYKWLRLPSRSKGRISTNPN